MSINTIESTSQSTEWARFELSSLTNIVEVPIVRQYKVCSEILMTNFACVERTYEFYDKSVKV